MKPWLTNYQIQKIESYLKKEHIMLEYGCGGSTLHFSKFVKTYISIEHNKEWIEKLTNIPSNVHIYYCPPNNHTLVMPVWTGSQEDFYDYINYVDKISIQKYNIVFIDGRARQYCAKKVLDYITTDSVVFIHDFFERPRYHHLLSYYDIIDEDCSDKITLVALKKKTRIDDT